jgi:lysophospholipase L1-like esterase
VASKAKEVLKLVAAQVALFMGLMIIADLFLWMAMPIENGLYGPLTKKFLQNEPGLKSEITYTQIANGLRSQSVTTLDRPDNTLRVLCLGASTTNSGNQETQDTWCGVLETELQHKYFGSGINIQTLSYGRPGDVSLDTAFWIERMFDRVKPDIVITLLGINDLTLRGSGVDDRFILPPLSQDRWSNFLALCADISQICRRLDKIKQQLNPLRQHEELVLQHFLEKKTQPGRKKKQAKVKQSWTWSAKVLPQIRKQHQKYPYVGDAVVRPDSTKDFASALNWMLTFFKQRGVSALILGQPTLWKPEMTAEEKSKLWFTIGTPRGRVRPSTAWLFKEMSRYNGIQQAEAEKFGFTYLDLDALVPKSAVYYFDDCHFTDSGSRRVAEVILPTVAELLTARQGRSKLNPLRAGIGQGTATHNGAN